MQKRNIMSQQEKQNNPHLPTGNNAVPNNSPLYDCEPAVDQGDLVACPPKKKRRTTEEKENTIAAVGKEDESSKMGRLLRAASRQTSAPTLAQMPHFANRERIQRIITNKRDAANTESNETWTCSSSTTASSFGLHATTAAGVYAAEHTKDSDEDSDDNGSHGTGCDEDSDLPKKNENGFTRTFPQRLMDVISHKDADKALVWSQDGCSFVIISPRIFVDKILPRFFKQSKFASFTRKLNRWGFKRLTTGPNAGAYYHHLFQRDKPDLCSQMYCYKSGSSASEQLQSQLLLQMSGQMQSLPNYATPNVGTPTLPKQLATSSNAGAYYNQLFQRDTPDLRSQMFCTRSGVSTDEQLRSQLVLQQSQQIPSPTNYATANVGTPTLPNLILPGSLPSGSLDNSLDTAMLAMIRRQRSQPSTPMLGRKNTLAETRRLVLSAYEENLKTNSMPSHPLPLPPQSPAIPTMRLNTNITEPAAAKATQDIGRLECSPQQRQLFYRASAPSSDDTREKQMKNKFARGA